MTANRTGRAGSQHLNSHRPSSADGCGSQPGPAQFPPTDPFQVRARAWLCEAGLGESNPFEVWDAGADPDLSRYLVGHGVFDILWQDKPTIVYAPAGGGKSAFRVRLAWACRVQEDGRRVFPISYLAPDPAAGTLADHLEPILKRAARELLLMLVYRPVLFLRLDSSDRDAVKNAMDENDPGLLQRFLPQIERAGSLAPLAESFDPSAARLHRLPDPDQVLALCAAFRQSTTATAVRPAGQRFDALLSLVLDVLGFEAVYLMVDGVDAWLETQHRPRQAATLLAPLLEQAPGWAGRRLYLKLFLPVELKNVLTRRLTKSSQSVIIRWDQTLLADVLRLRLLAASGGRFDSLDALSAPPLHNVDEELLNAVRTSPTPRELLVLVNQIILEHVRRDGQDSALELRDVQAAIRWYQTRARPFSP